MLVQLGNFTIELNKNNDGTYQASIHLHLLGIKHVDNITKEQLQQLGAAITSLLGA